MTHKLDISNTKEVFPLLGRFRTPHHASQTRDPTKGRESAGYLTLKASRIGLQDFHRIGGNKDFSLEGHKQNLAHTMTQRKGAVMPQETDPEPPASTAGSPVEVQVSKGSLQGPGDWQQLPGKVPFGINSLGGPQ